MKLQGYNEYMCAPVPPFPEADVGDFTITRCASSIFKFVDGRTVYLKDRDNEGYQFTEEERVLIVLSAVPI